MPYEVEKTGNLTREVTVTITGAERSRRIGNELKRLSKTANIRGFRKGRVPLGAVRQRYGEAVKQDVLDKLVREQLDKIIQESEQPVAHLGEPDFGELPSAEDEDFSFTVSMEVQPEVDPVGYLGMALERERVEVSKEDVDERLEMLRERYATLEPIALRETIAQGDVVTFDYQALGVEEHPELENFRGEGAQVEIGRGGSNLEGLEEGLTGLEFSGTHTIKVTPEEGFGAKDLVGEEISLEVSITEVKHKVLPELDDDFAKDTGEAETLLELRGKMREDIEANLEHEAVHVLEEQAVDKLLAQNEVELPPTFVEQQLNSEFNRRMQSLQQALQQGMSPAALGVDLETYSDMDLVRLDVEKSLRTQFLLSAIFEKEELKVEQEDVMGTIEHLAMHRGVAPQQMMQRLLQDPDAIQQINLLAMLDKTRAFLVDKAEVEELEPGALSAKEEAAEKSGAKEKKAAKKKAPAKAKKAKKAAAKDEGEEQAEAKKKAAPKKKAAAKKKSDAKKAEPKKKAAAKKSASKKKTTAKKKADEKSKEDDAADEG